MAAVPLLEPTAILCPELTKVLTLNGGAVDGLGLVKRLEAEICRRAHAIWKSSGEQQAEKNWLAAERTLIIRPDMAQEEPAGDLRVPAAERTLTDIAQEEPVGDKRAPAAERKLTRQEPPDIAQEELASDLRGPVAERTLTRQALPEEELASDLRGPVAERTLTRQAPPDTAQEELASDLRGPVAERMLISRQAPPATAQEELASDLRGPVAEQTHVTTQVPPDTTQEELSDLKGKVDVQKAHILALQQALQARDQEMADLKRQLSSAVGQLSSAVARAELPVEAARVESRPCAADLAPFWVLTESPENLAMMTASAGPTRCGAGRRARRGEICAGAALAKAASAERLVDLHELTAQQPLVKELKPSEIERVKGRLRRASAQVRVARKGDGSDPAVQHFAVRLQKWRSLDSQLLA